MKFDLMLYKANMVRSEEGVVVTSDVEEDTIYLRMENNDEEMIEFDEVVV